MVEEGNIPPSCREFEVSRREEQEETFVATSPILEEREERKHIGRHDQILESQVAGRCGMKKREREKERE